MTGMKMFKLWMVVMLLGLLPVVSEAQEEINNAINYTGDDLKVTIRITENQKDCKIEIIDTGKGIDEKDLPNIWNRYYKKEKNHKRNVVGTGLGLSIVKNILEQHNFKYTDRHIGVGI